MTVQVLRSKRSIERRLMCRRLALHMGLGGGGGGGSAGDLHASASSCVHLWLHASMLRSWPRLDTHLTVHGRNAGFTEENDVDTCASFKGCCLPRKGWMEGRRVMRGRKGGDCFVIVYSQSPCEEGSWKQRARCARGRRGRGGGGRRGGRVRRE